MTSRLEEIKMLVAHYINAILHIHNFNHYSIMHENPLYFLIISVIIKNYIVIV